MFKSTPTDELLAPLAQELAKERKEAVDKRAQSGLDGIWQKARAQFQGLDDKNRPTAVEGLSTMDSSVKLTGFKGTASERRSTVFDNITRSYTETGTSKVSDILLPTGKMPWDLKPTPVTNAEVLEGVLAKYPELFQSMPSELAQRLFVPPEQTKAAVEQAKRHINDYLSECQWMGEVREQILEAGKVGTGVLKGPVPRYVEPPMELKLYIQSLPPHVQADLVTSLFYRPYSECIKVENCFPDPSCGHSVQNGAYFWERIPDFSKRQLQDLKNDPAYFGEQVEACCKEGPKQVSGQDKPKGKPFELWIRTGRIDLSDFIEELEEMEEEAEDEGEGKDYSDLFMTVVLCNDRIVKMQPFWLKTEVFPYDFLLWEQRDDSWDGIGIPERIETPQRGLNAALRALHDNLAWSVGPQVLQVQDLIEPVDGDWTPYAYKQWKVKKDPFTQDIDPKNALSFLEFPNYSNDILPIINYWLNRAEQVAGLPLLLQGQPSTDSVGVSQQLQNNATTNLRQIVKACDDEVFVPHIQRYYEWVQMYGPESAQADAQVVAIGSSTLIVREMQQQVLLQLLDRSLQRQFNLSPERIMAAILEGNQFDAEQLKLTQEEMEELAQAEQQPDPRVEAARIDAESAKYKVDKDYEIEMLKLDQGAQSKNLDYRKAMDVTETQVAGQLSTAAMKEPAAPKVARPGEAAPKEEELSPEDALATLGLVA